MQRLRISDNHRFISYENGAPFFWLGDTAWELFSDLDREEIDAYLSVRASQSFNVIQTVALMDSEHTTAPNVIGQIPLKKNTAGAWDPSLPDLDSGYWDHVDYAVQKAAEYGLYMGLLPSWGDKWSDRGEKGSVIFTPENARIYGRFIGARYGACSHVVWIMGGDHPIENELHRTIIRAMAEGILETDGGGHLMTFHPPGYTSSSEFVHDEPWVDFHMLQTSHSTDSYGGWRKVANDYGLTPVRPVIDGEPRYEDHPASFRAHYGYYWDASDVRISAWWDVLSGACGHTYGHHCVWSFNKIPDDYFPMTWQDALQRPGAKQMVYLRRLVESRPFYERRPAPELPADEGDMTSHVAVSRGEKYVFAYSPLGLPLRLHTERISGNAARVSWYDPRTGDSRLEGIYPVSQNAGVCTFVPPSCGKGCDWVLVMDILD